MSEMIEAPRYAGLGQDERLCVSHAMAQWKASLSRADLSERDRVMGALVSYAQVSYAMRMTAEALSPSLKEQEEGN